MEFDVTIEIPKGQRNKYEVDHATGRIRLDRMLFTATRYEVEIGGLTSHDVGQPRVEFAQKRCVLELQPECRRYSARSQPPWVRRSGPLRRANPSSNGGEVRSPEWSANRNR